MTKAYTIKNHKLAMTFMEILIAGFFMVVVFIIGWMISSSFTGVKKSEITRMQFSWQMRR